MLKVPPHIMYPVSSDTVYAQLSKEEEICLFSYRFQQWQLQLLALL